MGACEAFGPEEYHYDIKNQGYPSATGGQLMVEQMGY
jgi:hypothetical protein